MKSGSKQWTTHSFPLKITSNVGYEAMNLTAVRYEMIYSPVYIAPQHVPFPLKYPLTSLCSNHCPQILKKLASHNPIWTWHLIWNLKQILLVLGKMFLLNFTAKQYLKSCAPQHRQIYNPSSNCLLYFPENGFSVPPSRATLYSKGLRTFRHSSGVTCCGSRLPSASIALFPRNFERIFQAKNDENVICKEVH